MSDGKSSMREMSLLLLAAGAFSVVAVGCFTAIAVAAALGRPFPGLPQDVNDGAQLTAVVNAAVATLCIYAALLVRR